MIENNNHPSLDQIIEFAELSKDTLDKSKLSEYFSMACHFDSCEECCKVKDQLVEFNEVFDLVMSDVAQKKSLKEKIMILESLNGLQDTKSNEALHSVGRELMKDKADQSEYEALYSDDDNADTLTRNQLR